MSLAKTTPCDIDGICPYADMHSGYMNSCDYWCGAEEPEDDPADNYWDFEDQFWDDGFAPATGV